MKYKLSTEMEKAHLLNLYEDIFFFMSKMDKKLKQQIAQQKIPLSGWRVYDNTTEIERELNHGIRHVCTPLIVSCSDILGIKFISNNYVTCMPR